MCNMFFKRDEWRLGKRLEKCSSVYKLITCAPLALIKISSWARLARLSTAHFRWKTRSLETLSHANAGWERPSLSHSVRISSAARGYIVTRHSSSKSHRHTQAFARSSLENWSTAPIPSIKLKALQASHDPPFSHHRIVPLQYSWQAVS